MDTESIHLPLQATDGPYENVVVDNPLASTSRIRTDQRNQDVNIESQRNNKRHRHPDYEYHQQRRNTYVNWPSDRVQTPDILAEAGFFYTGQGDRVRCYCCGGGLQHWDTEDEPWIEHARWFPFCEHVKAGKGEHYIRFVQATIQASEGEEDDETNEVTTEMNELAVNGASGEQKESDDLIYHPAAQSVVSVFGFSTAAVKMAIQECKEKGVRWNAEVLANMLCDKLDRGETLPEDPPRPKSPPRLPVDVSTNEGLMMERKDLLRRLKCVQCGKNDANILFLPCAHRKLCKSCCENVSVCPICEKHIKEKIQTFMA